MTAVRAVLVAVVAVSVATGHAVGAMVTVMPAALALDAVDGIVARRTGTVSELGARLDMEVDAAAVFVLSVAAMHRMGAWVLAFGLARYAFALLTALIPWLRAPTPPSYWRKTVAAGQAIALTVVSAGLLPDRFATAVLVVALVALAVSFGTQLGWLRRTREPRPSTPLRRASGRVVTTASVALIWLALVVPDHVDRTDLAQVLRVPLEGLGLVVVALLLPAAARRAVAAVVGVLLAAAVVLRLLDTGFERQLDRPFDPLTDWTSLRSGVGVLRDSIGSGRTHLVVAGAVALVALLAIVLPLATARTMATAAAHRRGATRLVGVLMVVWLLGVTITPSGAPRVASVATAGLIAHEIDAVHTELADRSAFARQLDSPDPYAELPPTDLLGALRGKDVVLAFVESYGKVAVSGSSIARGIDAVVEQGTSRLAAAGLYARSAFLTSPTWGGGSWRAHSTLQSGTWISDDQRYGQLLSSDRLSLSAAFGRAGWRTVSDVPSDTRDWPEGQRYYGFDAMYDSRDLGYAGPRFSYGRMPDQYIWKSFYDRELSTPHSPVMAEIDLVSSHTPWAPLPHLVAWDAVGDGSVFDPMPAQGDQPDEVWPDPQRIAAAYGQSVRYSLHTLVSFLTTFHDDNDLVLVVLGDHQPGSVVGSRDNHDVPISVIAKDPAVLSRISPWHWQPGLLPSPSGPTWPMDAFRDRFLAAFDERLH